MADLLKLAAILATAFASTFLIIQGLGLLPEKGVVAWLEELRSIHPLWLMAGIVALLMLDLLIAVPTMVTILLAGWLLGTWLGGSVSAFGLMAMGGTGYLIGRVAGRPALARFFKDDRRLEGIEAAFARNDLLTLVVCQALPILPELSATLAGIARMPLSRFAFGYGLGVVPFAFVVASGGAASNPDDLRPAILTVIAV
jgi:uncharacterized membrane protein YdjX (TVP38/TMEM64 family)